MIIYNIVHQQCCMNIVTMFEKHLNRVVAEFKVCKIRIQIMLEHRLLTPAIVYSSKTHVVYDIYAIFCLNVNIFCSYKGIVDLSYFKTKRN